MKTFHILNGDCLAGQLINKDFIVCHECLIDGNLKASSLTDFWKMRAEFFAETFKTTTDEYYTKTVNELGKLINIPDNSEVCLWFENDLFCQANMWFIISLLVNQSTLTIFRIFPIIEKKEDIWKGFGISNAENLEKAYTLKIRCTSKDLELGKNLWTAFQKVNLIHLKELLTCPF